MKTNERFLEALRHMNATMKIDNKAGHQWKYCNVTKKKVYGFENKRKAGKYLTNCVDGVQDALRIAGVKATAWYGGNGNIVWLNAHFRTVWPTLASSANAVVPSATTRTRTRSIAMSFFILVPPKSSFMSGGELRRHYA